MRVARSKTWVQTHQVEQLIHPAVDFFAAHDVVHQQRLANNLADRHARVKAGIRILEDHLHLLAHLAHFFAF